MTNSVLQGGVRKSCISRLVTEEWDLLVIGGGITGAGIALDAVTRGMKTALVEKSDFASGTSNPGFILFSIFLSRYDIPAFIPVSHHFSRILPFSDRTFVFAIPQRSKPSSDALSLIRADRFVSSSECIITNLQKS